MNLREADILVDRILQEAETLEKNFEDKATKLLEKAERTLTVTETACAQLEKETLEKLARILRAARTDEATARKVVGEERVMMLRSKGRLLSVSKQLHAKHTQAEVAHARELKLEAKQAVANSAETHSPTDEQARVSDSADPRASTLAIFDSIVFAMSNWSNEGDTAPDFELACQSILFPTIYERVMKNEDDYYIEEVPVSALEVVKRGREYIKMLRDTAQASLVDPEIWENYTPMVQEWWVNDALPLLYGARSEEWDGDTPFSLLEVQAWKSQPASRALRFPLLFDGMELVDKHRDQIRETTGLPEFNKQTLQTRINP
jgi:hypothetical protein